jgi:hypothetical protein
LLERLLIVSCLNVGERPKHRKKRIQPTGKSLFSRFSTRFSFLASSNNTPAGGGGGGGRRFSFFSSTASLPTSPTTGRQSSFKSLFKGNSMMNIPSMAPPPSKNVITVDEDYGKSIKNSDRFDLEPWSISEKFSAQINILTEKLNLVKLLQETSYQTLRYFKKSFLRLPFVASNIVAFNLFMHKYFRSHGNDKVNAF